MRKTIASQCILSFVPPDEQVSGISVAAKYQGLLLHALTVRRCDGLCHQVMVRGQIAYRIGIGRIAREQVGLATAAAEIARFFRAAAARLLHPRIAAEVG